MDTALRASMRRSFVVVLVLAALGGGYLLHGGSGAARSVRHAVPHTPSKLTAFDLIAAAEAAPAGIYLQYDHITAAAGAPHTGHIAASSFQFGTSRAVSHSAGGTRVSSPNLSEITLTKEADKYTAPLFNESLNGNGLVNAVVYLTEINGAGKNIAYLEFRLEHVYVTGYSTSSGGAKPTESISLAYSKITMVATFAGAPQQTVSYDLTTGGV